MDTPERVHLNRKNTLTHATKNIQSQLLAVMPYLFGALLLITTALLLIELAPSQGGFPHIDKIAHASFFAMLSTTGALAFSKRSTTVYSSLAAYGVLTEWLQATVTVTRHASFYDWLADIVGILLGIAITALLRNAFKV